MFMLAVILSAVITNCWGLTCYTCTQNFIKYAQSEPSECGITTNAGTVYCIYYRRTNTQTNAVEVKYLAKQDNELYIQNHGIVTSAEAGYNSCYRISGTNFEADIVFCQSDYCNAYNSICPAFTASLTSLHCYNCNFNFTRYVDSEPSECQQVVTVSANGYCVYHRFIDIPNNKVYVEYRAQPTAEIVLPDGHSVMGEILGNNICINSRGPTFDAHTFFCQSNLCNTFNSVCPSYRETSPTTPTPTNPTTTKSSPSSLVGSLITVTAAYLLLESGIY